MFNPRLVSSCSVCLLRVAKEEKHNKMSPNSLAIVFAPCVLRSPDVDNPLLGMKDVSKTTTWVFFFLLKKPKSKCCICSCQMHVGLSSVNFDSVVCRCVEILISEQFRRYNEKMQNIQELEYAEALAVNQLKLKRQNTVINSRPSAFKVSTSALSVCDMKNHLSFACECNMSGTPLGNFL